MSEKADEIVKELSKGEWADLYDKQNMSIQQKLPPPEEIKKENRHYLYEWALKNIKKNYKVDAKILDVGCGQGNLVYMLKEDGYNPVGIDVAPKAIEFCKEHVKGVEFKQMFGEDMEFKDNSFDVVSCQEMLEHVKHPRKIIKEMLRVLKPSGLLIVTVPINMLLDNNGQSGHIQHWGFYEIMHLFEEFGNAFKIHWLNKWQKKYGDGERTKNNLFGILFKNEVNDNVE